MRELCKLHNVPEPPDLDRLLHMKNFAIPAAVLSSQKDDDGMQDEDEEDDEEDNEEEEDMHIEMEDTDSNKKVRYT